MLATDELGVAVLASTLLILTIALLATVVERALGRRTAVAEEMARLYGEAQVEIGERIRVEQALNEQDERLRLALDASGMGMWEWDRAAERIVLSPPCSRMHSLYDDFDGDPDRFRSTIHPEDREHVRHAFDDLLVRGTPYDTEYRIPMPDGSNRWIRSRGRRYDDARHGARIIGVCLDVTPQHVMAEQLRQSQKIEAIGQLAGGIAHDFNNVLTAITGTPSCCSIPSAPGDPRRADVEEIKRAAQRAHRPDAAAARVRRRQMLAAAPIDLGELVARDGAHAAPADRRGHRAGLALATGDTPVRADPAQIQQMLLNLVVNARDAMPDGRRAARRGQRARSRDCATRRHRADRAGRLLRHHA